MSLWESTPVPTDEFNQGSRNFLVDGGQTWLLAGDNPNWGAVRVYCSVAGSLRILLPVTL